MNKFLASLALLSLGVGGSVGTLNESNVKTTVRVIETSTRKKLSKSVYGPSFKYFLIDTGSELQTEKETIDLKRSNEANTSLVNENYLNVGEAFSGNTSLKLKNQTLAIRLTYLFPEYGNYTFSFWAKNITPRPTGLAVDLDFNVKFDHYDVDGNRAWYSFGKLAVTENSKGWSKYSYTFKDMTFDRTSMVLIVNGEWLIDDIQVLDKDGFNYVLEGDFDGAELTQYKPQKAGYAKQPDGSIAFGFDSFNFEYNAAQATSGGYNESYFQIKPAIDADALNVSFDYIGLRVGVQNRKDEVNNIVDNSSKTWARYSHTFGPITTSNDIYFGYNNVGTRQITYIKNLSLTNSAGEELLPSKLTKEGYAKSFAESLMADIVCDGVGVTPPSETEWGTLRYCFEHIPEMSQEYIMSLTPNETGSEIEKALYKYSYIVSKYGNKYYDFLDYKAQGKASSKNEVINVVSSSETYVAITIVGVCLAAFSLIILTKKKKAN